MSTTQGFMTLLAVALTALSPGIAAATLDISPTGRWGPNGTALVLAPGSRDALGAVRDGAGGAFLTWRDRRHSALGEIHALRVGSGGGAVAGWPSAGLRVREAGDTAPTAIPIADGTGGLFVVVNGSSAGVSHVWAHRFAPDGTTAAGWPVDGVVLDAADFQPASYASDGAGGLMAFGIRTLPPATSQTNVRRWTPGGVLDPAWPAGGVGIRNYNSAWQQLTPAASVGDGEGGVFVTWHASWATDTGLSTWGMFAHVENGTVAWTQQNNGVSDAPLLLSDDQNGAIALFTEGGTGRFSLYEPTGPQWSGTSAFGPASVRGIVGNGAGGAIYVAVYLDGYRAFAFNAQGQQPAGNWNSQGVLLFTFSVGSLAAVEPDLEGGMLVLSGRPQEDGGYALYAQYLDQSGQSVSGWTPSGHLLRLTDAGPTSVQALLDGAGGYLVFWVDPNGGAPAIYGQRLGVPSPVAVAPGLGHSDLSALPNPFVAKTTLRFSVAARSARTLFVTDAAGRVVRRLASGIAEAGPQGVEWDGRDDAGREVPAGIYFSVLRVGDDHEVGKLVRVR